jgi:hypothetical protein
VDVQKIKKKSKDSIILTTPNTKYVVMIYVIGFGYGYGGGMCKGSNFALVLVLFVRLSL